MVRSLSRLCTEEQAAVFEANRDRYLKAGGVWWLVHAVVRPPGLAGTERPCLVTILERVGRPPAPAAGEAARQLVEALFPSLDELACQAVASPGR